MSTIFLLNIAFYLFSNNQFQKEIARQYDALTNMSAHLAHEENIEILVTYLEHYTHNFDVTIQFNHVDGSPLFTNDPNEQLSKFQAVYYEDSLVGYIAVNFESSRLGVDILYGFIGLNLISITLFACGMYILYRFLKKETMKIKTDFKQIETQGSVFSYVETNQLHRQLMNSLEVREKQRVIYESHIRSLAHDIKTPLSVIRIYADSLRNETLSPTQAVFLEIQEETDKISNLIPKFIEMNHDALPYLQDISRNIEKYVHKYQDVFSSKQMEIIAHLEPFFVTISDQDLERLLEHILFNAFYYSNPQSRISLFVHHQSRMLVVEDEGIGMTNETIQEVLQGPYRAKEAMKMNEKGSGLGLQIVQEIVHKLDAKLQIDSVVGGGTKITIQFPDVKVS